MKEKLINLLGGYTAKQTSQIAEMVAQQAIEESNNQRTTVHGFMHHIYNNPSLKR